MIGNVQPQFLGIKGHKLVYNFLGTCREPLRKIFSIFSRKLEKMWFDVLFLEFAGSFWYILVVNTGWSIRSGKCKKIIKIIMWYRIHNHCVHSQFYHLPRSPQTLPFFTIIVIQKDIDFDIIIRNQYFNFQFLLLIFLIISDDELF